MRQREINHFIRHLVELSSEGHIGVEETEGWLTIANAKETIEQLENVLPKPKKDQSEIADIS